MNERGQDADLEKDREEVLGDKAEELHRQSVSAMRESLSDIDPAKQEAARQIIARMEETGKRFREDRSADDRDSPEAREDETSRARDTDAERQKTEATTRAASRTVADRAAMDRQVANDASNRDRASREDAQVEREIERDDDRDR